MEFHKNRTLNKFECHLPNELLPWPLMFSRPLRNTLIIVANRTRGERVKSARLSPVWEMEGILIETGRDVSKLSFKHIAFEVMAF